MDPIKNVLKTLVGVKDVVIEDVQCYEAPKIDPYSKELRNITHIRIKLRPNARRISRCPVCGKKCAGYDRISEKPKVWRALDACGVIVELEYPIRRIQCKEHGVITESVPWAYPNSRFTKTFDQSVTWLAKCVSKSAIAGYMRIDWQTVGNCIARVSKDLEPDHSKRWDNLQYIGIDETSYKKGHKYLTVIVNHETNEVVWVAKDHGKSVLTQFFESLTEEQRSSIKVVTGDGARWITDCVNEYLPNCERCVDPFHVVEWVMDALNKVRIESWNRARKKAAELEKDKSVSKEKVQKAKNEASEVKGSSYALGKAPEHLTENQKMRLEMIQAQDKTLYRAYRMKETIRVLLKCKSVEEAERALKSWLWWASHSRIDAFKELAKKIRRHKQHILNTIKWNLSNARIEATNNKIKLIIRKSYGFRNIDNLIEMIYLVCSKIEVPLPNRGTEPQICA